MREIIPGIAIGAIIFPDSAPGPFGKIRPPQMPALINPIFGSRLAIFDRQGSLRAIENQDSTIGSCNQKSKIESRKSESFPFDRAWWLARNIVANPVNAFDFIDNPTGDPR